MEFHLIFDDLMVNGFDNFADLSLLPVLASNLYQALVWPLFDVSQYLKVTTYISYVHDGRVMAATRKGKLKMLINNMEKFRWNN